MLGHLAAPLQPAQQIGCQTLHPVPRLRPRDRHRPALAPHLVARLARNSNPRTDDILHGLRAIALAPALCTVYGLTGPALVAAGLAARDCSVTGASVGRCGRREGCRAGAEGGGGGRVSSLSWRSCVDGTPQSASLMTGRDRPCGRTSSPRLSRSLSHSTLRARHHPLVASVLSRASRHHVPPYPVRYASSSACDSCRWWKRLSSGEWSARARAREGATSAPCSRRVRCSAMRPDGP